MALKHYEEQRNILQAERETFMGKIIMKKSDRDKVLSAAVIFKNGAYLKFGRNNPELLQVFQNLLIQKIWSSPFDEIPSKEFSF